MGNSPNLAEPEAVAGPYTGTVIRPAVDADIPALVAMGGRFVDEHYHGLITANPEQMAITGRWLMANGLLLVADGDAGPVGMIGVACFTHPISGDRMASELFWYVDPAHRGAGVRLLRAAEQWAREQGATRMQMVAPNDKVRHFYQRLGFRHVETAYQREL